MVWAYVMENDYGAEKHNNTPIFKLVNQLKIPEEQVVFDQDNSRDEFCKLLESMGVGDKLIIRSVEDLADESSPVYMCFSRKRNSRQVTERLVLRAEWVDQP